MLWHQSSRPLAQRRAPRGVGRRPWQPRPQSAPGLNVTTANISTTSNANMSSYIDGDSGAGDGGRHLADQLESLVAMTRNGRLTAAEFEQAKAAVLSAAAASAAAGSGGRVSLPPGLAAEPSGAVEVAGAPPATVVVLGGPGSGRGTICRNLAAEFPGIVHLSVRVVGSRLPRTTAALLC